MEQSKLMARLAYQALDDKKGEDIQVIDISQVSVLADYIQKLQLYTKREEERS